MAIPDIDPADAKLMAQARAAAAKNAATQTSQVNAASDALRKLTSGATLTDAEKALLNIGSTGTSGSGSTGGNNPPAGGGNNPPPKTVTKTVTNADGTVTTFYSDGTSTTSGTPKPAGLTQADVDAAVKAALDAANAGFQAKYDALLNNQKQQQRAGVTTALADFTASLTSAGMGGLVDTINKWILEDKTAAQIAIDIRKEQVYKDRFPGMEALAKAGKAVSEGTYISMERGMIGILKAYGLDDKVLGTTQKLGEVIGGLVNVQEYENRVQLAADHVKKNADVLANLKEYYGVDTAGAMSYLLDPKVGMDVINKQVRAAEIGAASDLYNFNLDAGAAESFINAAGTADLNALKQEFGKARLLANTQARLSAIEGYQYKDTEAVAATLGNDQLKMLESQKRAEREVARYSGGSGIGQGSLKQASTI